MANLLSPVSVQTPKKPLFKVFKPNVSVKRSLLATYIVVSLAPFASNAIAQAAAEATASTLKPVTVQPRRSGTSADAFGIGDAPLVRTPLSAESISAEQIKSLGANRLADVIKLDASVSDAYNTVGYWDYATVRGFVLSNKSNFSRDGLPISTETYIPLDNKERVDILKGTSGLQTGTSAPGGLINYQVKRPTQNDLRSVGLELRSFGGYAVNADLGGRFGLDKAFGYRVNLSQEGLNAAAPGTKGSRQTAALAMDWRIDRDSLLEGEVEYSRKSQPSLPGLSLLGAALPAPNARININNQPWSQPVELEGTTGSLRYERALSAAWRASVQVGTQRLTSNDRAAFPFGCFDAGTNVYNADRYCSNGDYDLYDYRSDGEKRNTSAAKLELKGQLATGSVRHALSMGALFSRYSERGQTGAYNATTPGTINLYAPTVVAPDPSATAPYTNRNERSTELFAADTIQWNEQLSTWLGLRHTRLQRASNRTEPTDPRATDYSAGISTPWLAAAYQINAAHMLYASAGQGVESQVVPNRPAQYTNAGVALPALKSSQAELGIKGSGQDFNWSMAYFNIRRPVSNLDGCARLGISPCMGDYDGQAVHSGLEANAQAKFGAWTLGGGITAIKARRDSSTLEPLTNGQRPTNVPAAIARLNAQYRFAALPGLAASGHMSHEGARNVLSDGSVALPAWTRLDAGLSYATTLQGVATNWTLGIDNLLNRQFFKESPTQFGHIYLFPQQPRSLRISMQVAL